MFRHYLGIAWRQLKKRKFYSFINIIGLAVGILCCLVIAVYVKHELSYDQYHAKKDRIYRVVQAFGDGSGTVSKKLSPKDYQVWGCAPVGPALQNNFPQIEKIVQFMSPVSLLLEAGNTRIQQDNLLFMDSTAFDVFSWKMVAGDPHTALVAPYNIVLTKSVAEKFFGSDNPVGKTLKIDNSDTYNVSGVMEDVPANSQFTFSGLISMTTSRKYRAEIFDWWGYVDFYTYVLLKDKSNISALESNAADFVKRNNEQDKAYKIGFEKMTDAYLHSEASRQPGITGSLFNVYLFTCIAVFILLIACINFMNLSTARSMERAKEVGVRKVLGVRPASLVTQFLFESVLLSLAALLIALPLSVSGISLVSKLAGKDLMQGHFFTPLRIALMITGAVGLGLLAGIYPAKFLSAFKPIAVLKGKFRPTAGGISIRRGLVVFQFAMSITLIAATAIVYSQLKYVDKQELGFQKDQLLIVNFEGDQKVQEQIEMVKKSIGDNPGVSAVGASRAVPGEFLPNAGTEIEGPDKNMLGKAPLIYEIDYDFIPTLGIKMAAGRNYDRKFPTDSAQGMIINEAAAKLYGYSNPADAVGKKFNQWGRSGMIVGVVKDFNFRSLHQAVEPLTLRYGYPYSLNRIAVSIKADNVPATLAGIKKTWDKIAPQRPFMYHFLDESFGAQYEADRHFQQLFTLFSVLAICIACLGLFGLSTFMAQQRIKEIGIRKVLGSSVGSIVYLLSKDFIKLVLIAAAVAIPLCWWAMNQWLEGFAYRIKMSPVPFIEAGLAALLVALITIAWQSVRAARANPVKSLRSE